MVLSVVAHESSLESVSSSQAIKFHIIIVNNNKYNFILHRFPDQNI